VKYQNLMIDDGQITDFKVNLVLTFVLDDWPAVGALLYDIDTARTEFPRACRLASVTPLFRPVLLEGAVLRRSARRRIRCPDRSILRGTVGQVSRRAPACRRRDRAGAFERHGLCQSRRVLRLLPCGDTAPSESW